MKPEASHVTSGPSVPAEDLAWPKRVAVDPVMSLPKPHLEVDEGAPVTPWGGLALVMALVKRFTWEWKRFRRAFVSAAAQVIQGGRQLKRRLGCGPRCAPQRVAALRRLQC